MSNKLSSLIGSGVAKPAPHLVITNQLKESLVGTHFLSNEQAKSSISLEGFDRTVESDIIGSLQSLRQVINSVAQSSKFYSNDSKSANFLSPAMEDAGIVGAIVARAPKEYFASKQFVGEEFSTKYTNLTQQGNNGATLTYAIPAVGEVPRVADMQAFDERENKNVLEYSISYNLQASRQGAFGEAFFPTVVITPDNFGLNLAVRILVVQNDFLRQTNGTLANYNRQNIINAIVDSTILKESMTQLIPVLRSSTPAATTDNVSLFSTVVAPKNLVVDNNPLTTAPLAFNTPSFDLIAICQTNAQLQNGTRDTTDTIDPSIVLDKLYVTIGGPQGEVFSFDTSMLPTSNFNFSPQGNTKLMRLNFSSNAFLLSAGMLTDAGVPSALLAALGTNTVRLSLKAVGEIVQDKGDTTMTSLPVTISAINDSQGNALDLKGATAAPIIALLTGATGAALDSYELKGYTTNSNRRQRGKIFDIQHINYLYSVPLLPPISALRPVTNSDQNDGQLIGDLISAVKTKTANDAVTALLAARDFLEQYIGGGTDLAINKPELFGAASQLVIPAFLTDTLDAAAAVDSLTSTARAEDLQNAIMNKLRDMAVRLFVQSHFGPASEAVYEGAPPKPLVIIGTDPYIHRYLQLTGDLRYLGDQFDYKIVPSYDNRMVNKIIFSFGSETSLNSGVPNPLHFGSMAWRPELTIMLPVMRNGANVMEMTVQPSYRHIPHLPVMGELEITNIQAVIGGKVSIDVNTAAVTDPVVPTGSPQP